MKKIFILLLFQLTFFYLLFFRTKEVTYLGENENWEVEVFAMLIGMEVSKVLQSIGRREDFPKSKLSYLH